MGSRYTHVFSPLTIRGVQFKNRVEMAPTSPKRTTKEGYITQAHIDYFRPIARGGAAIVTMGNCSVDLAHAQDEPRQVALDGDDVCIGLSRLNDMCRQYGAQCSLEINHAGLDAVYAYNGVAAIGPSAQWMPKEQMKARLSGREPIPAIEMDLEMIHAVQQMYIEGAYRCKQAGMQMCMVHGGHANLIGQFSSPLYNHRRDAYGGTLENRARFALEIVQGIRRRCGEDFVIEFRVSADEMHPDGMHFDETKAYLQMLDGWIDIVNVSAGLHTDYNYFRYWWPNLYMGEMINVPYARELKKILSCRVTAVAGICNLDNAEQILREGWADFVALARPLMADPEMVRKYAHDAPETVRPCARCGYCGKRISAGHTLACGVNPALGREDELVEGRIRPAPAAKKVVVIGGGPAGLSAAITLSRRGHDVTLFEQNACLGGNLVAAAAMEQKTQMRRYLAYIRRQAQQEISEIRTGVRATPELVMALCPQAIIVAVGAQPVFPDVAGITLPHVHWAADAELGRVAVGERVVVIGGGALGLECAMTQVAQGRQVVVLEQQPELTDSSSAAELGPLLRQSGAQIYTAQRLTRIEKSYVRCIDRKTGMQVEHPCDTVLIATGLQAAQAEAAPFLHLIPETEIYVVGDARKARGLGEAVREGFDAALQI